MISIDESHLEKLDAAALVDTLRKDMEELDWSSAGLMDRMVSLGDYRSPATILRGINRALAGEVKPSGELLALVRQAVRFKRRLLRTYESTNWTELEDGSHTAEVDDFRITLVPRTKGRWHVVVVHNNGYSAPYPRWQNTLETAKNIAFITLDNAQDWLHICAEEKARNAVEKTA